MHTLESLKKKIETVTDLLSVVRTMKSLAAVNIRQFERAAHSLEEYSRVVDLGCGEGVVAGMLRESLPEMDYVGIDVSEEAVNAARTFHPTLEFRVGSVFDPPAELGSADVTLCLEVIEHLEDPEGAMTRIMEWTRGHALISVPWEPWFRLGNLVRGRHIHDLGNHPEHIQQFTPRSFSRLLAGHSNSFRVWTCFPWILGLVRRP